MNTKATIKSNAATEHKTNCTCSICGLTYKGISFKRGYVCEPCLEYIKDTFPSNKNSPDQPR